jgi:hypothetical protein
MLPTPNYQLLKQAYAIIDGIPETAIAFGRPRAKEGAAPAGVTVCSPEGWLALHPAFNQRGLSVSPEGDQLYLYGEPVPGTGAALIVGSVFELPAHEAAQLFGDRDVFTGGDDSGLSDKSLWQRRLREYLRQKGQIDETPESGSPPKCL